MYSYLPPKTNELNQFFEMQDIKRHPTFMRCNMTRDNYQSVFNDYIKPFDVNFNDNDKCPETINPNAPSGKQSNGLIKYIDIDSELKGNNRVQDKCYYNKYIIDPLGRDTEVLNSPLKCHKNIFRINETQSHKRAESGSLLDKNMIPNPCIKMQQFTLCKNTPITSKQIKTYDFSQRDYCAQYPCQKVFNNMTKRSMYPSSYTPQDLNKIHSNVDYSDLQKRNNDHTNIDKFYDTDLTCMPYSITTEYGTKPSDCKMTQLTEF